MQTTPVCPVTKRQTKQSKEAGFIGDVVATPIITHDMQKRVIESIACIRERIGLQRNVEKIAYSPKGQLITIWTFVTVHDPKTLRSIYKEEINIMSEFQDLRFDFTVIFDSKSDAPDNFITEIMK